MLNKKYKTLELTYANTHTTNKKCSFLLTYLLLLFRILPTTEISIYFVLELPIFFLTLHVAIVLLSCWKSCSARSADKKLLTDSPHTHGIDHLLIRRIKGHIRPLKFNYASIEIPLCLSITILRKI